MNGPGGPVDRPRISWDETTEAVGGAVSVGATEPVGATAAPGRRRRRRPLLVAGAVALLVVTVVGAVVAVALINTGRPPAPAPDRYAPEQVALRYRALGATLLDGAVRCAPLDLEPGEIDKVDCSFGAWSIVLTGYDTPSRIDTVRERSSTPDPDSLRSADAVQPDAAFAMDENAAGLSTVYWDALAPRPVSATVSTTELTLPALLAFFDARGSTLIARPEQPGPAFESGELWDLASSSVVRKQGECGPVPAVQRYPDAVEKVRCTFPNGASADFLRLSSAAAINRYRTEYSSESEIVPGTLRLGAWETLDRPIGQRAEYVLLEDGNSYLYFDRRETLCLGLMWHPEFSQDQLLEFFVS